MHFIVQHDVFTSNCNKCVGSIEYLQGYYKYVLCTAVQLYEVFDSFDYLQEIQRFFNVLNT